MLPKPRTLNIEPVEGRTVRNPATGEIIAQRTTVPASSYWYRRIAKGDVKQTGWSAVDPDAPPAGKSAPKGKPKRGAEA